MSAYSKDLKNAKQNVEQAKPVQSEAPIAVDGFQQVLEMLRIADPAFRESLLRRLAQRDRELARNLRADLGM